MLAVLTCSLCYKCCDAEGGSEADICYANYLDVREGTISNALQLKILTADFEIRTMNFESMPLEIHASI